MCNSLDVRSGYVCIGKLVHLVGCATNRLQEYNIILSPESIIIHDSGWNLLSRYSLLYGYTITYHVAPLVFSLWRVPWSLTYTLDTTFVSGRLSTSFASPPSCCAGSTERGRRYAFGCMIAIRGGYRMARGWHYAKLSLSSALLLSFSGMCILLLFLFFCRFCFVSSCFGFRF